MRGARTVSVGAAMVPTHQAYGPGRPCWLKNPFYSGFLPVLFVVTTLPALHNTVYTRSVGAFSLILMVGKGILLPTYRYQLGSDAPHRAPCHIRYKWQRHRSRPRFERIHNTSFQSTSLISSYLMISLMQKRSPFGKTVCFSVTLHCPECNQSTFGYFTSRETRLEKAAPCTC